MRYGIFSDVHANLDAFESVIDAMEKENIDEYLCLGDTVGYGAQPSECIAKVRNLNATALCGNHDLAAIERLNIEFFNFYARRASYWTRDNLTNSDITYLESLNFVEHYDNFAIVHSTIYCPEEFNYILTLEDAEINFSVLDKPICFMAHSHVPVSFFDTDPITYNTEPEIKLEPGQKYLINVGSVGQPRDGDPRSAYAVYDTEQQRVWIRRVEYDIESAMNKILDADLPDILAHRLKEGK